MEGFTDISTGEARRGYVDVVKELESRFSNIDEIVTEKIKKILLGSLVNIYGLTTSYKTMMSFLV